MCDGEWPGFPSPASTWGMSPRGHLSQPASSFILSCIWTWEGLPPRFGGCLQLPCICSMLNYSCKKALSHSPGHLQTWWRNVSTMVLLQPPEFCKGGHSVICQPTFFLLELHVNVLSTVQIWLCSGQICWWLLLVVLVMMAASSLAMVLSFPCNSPLAECNMFHLKKSTLLFLSPQCGGRDWLLSLPQQVHQGARYHPGHVWEHHGAWDIETGMRFQIKLFSAEYVICCRWATAACVRVWPSGCWSCSSMAGSASIQVSCFQSLTDILMYYSSPPCWHKDMASQA